MDKEEQTEVTMEESENSAITQALKAMEDRLTENMQKMIEPLQTSIDQLINMKKEWEKSVKEINTLKIDKKILAFKIKKVEDENAMLSNRLQKLEDKLMESNIIMSGVKEGAWETDNVTRELVINEIAETVIAEKPEDKKKVASRIPIKSTRRIGRYNSMRPRSICISFNNKSDTDMLIERKKSLKQGVFVDREYNEQDEEKRRKLRPYLRAARKLEKYKGKCKLEGTTLHLLGKKYTVDNLHTLPTELSGYNISTTSDGNSIGFFGSQNPFSNFHNCNFTYNDVKYHSTEQFIQNMKALHFGDTSTASEIMNASSALECKRISKKIVNYDKKRWEENAKGLCLEGIKAKFVQNPSIMALLENTGDQTIVESCHDELWGTGVPLYDQNCLNRSYWKHQGILGEILQEIRTWIRAIKGVNNNSPKTTTVPP